MITSMRGCVAYNEFWPWPISSRSFGLGLENHVRSVASTVLDGFFLYLIQMITSMRRCVACDDLWPWPISSRSFDLEFENRVRSVTFSVLDRLFPYLPQIITTIRGCVACYVYKKKIQNSNFSQIFLIFWLSPWKKSTILLAFFPYLAQIIITIRGCVACNDLWPWPIFQGHSALTLKIVSTLQRLQFWMDSFHIWYKWSLAWEGVLHVMIFDLDLYLQGHSTLTLKIVSAL